MGYAHDLQNTFYGLPFQYTCCHVHLQVKWIHNGLCLRIGHTEIPEI